MGGFAVEGCMTSSLGVSLILAMPNMPLLEMKVKSSSLLWIFAVHCCRGRAAGSQRRPGSSARSSLLEGTTMGEAFWMNDKIWHKQIIPFSSGQDSR
jgi:hypothetical protein